MPEQALKLVETEDQYIIVRQMPVIEQQLEALKPEIEAMVKEALAMECTEENVQVIKKMRAELNKKSKMLEDRRIQIKTQIMAPYDAMAHKFGVCVTEPFRNADNELRRRIAEVEDSVKLQKENEIKAYYAEYAASVGVMAAYERANINVTLSASMKSLKEQARTFIDRIAQDTSLINEMETGDEIMVEYKKTLDLAKSISTINERNKELERQKQAREQAAEQARQRKEAVAKIESAAAKQAPVVEFAPVVAQHAAKPEKDPNEVLTVTFKVKAERWRLKALKDYLEKGGFDFE